jgi:hypothetical protein
MAGKPYRSSLIPCEDEIISLRRCRPPMPYAQIAELLRQEHNLVIQAPAIFKFIKVRSRGRKVYSFQRIVSPRKPQFIPLSKKSSNAGSASDPEPKFEFKWSDRYNLTRLPPEVAAARRKKLEEEGH